jgi:hypothetical protein
LFTAFIKFCYVVCMTVDGVNRFIGRFEIVTTNNYNTIAVSTLYNSVEHTVFCSQSVTRRFLVTAPTLAVPLPPAKYSLHTLLYRTE